MINYILWIVMGGVAGWIASMIMKSPQGIIVDIIVGIVGACLGGFVMNLLGQQGVTGFNIPSLLVSILGAVILIAILRFIGRNT